MSQYLDKEKLLKWANDNYFEKEYSHRRASAYQHLLNEISTGRFDNYAAHNAVALLDDLEIKLNEANREKDELYEALSDRATTIEYLSNELQEVRKENERLKEIDHQGITLQLEYSRQNKMLVEENKRLSDEHAAMKETLEEDSPGPRFQMDANGKLTWIADHE